ncbi:hypothetical protein ABGB18_07925 [Nonomuraea sp. B12E4]|uniref:hypothetical protein n=1 Tax=Nonomuraea sp. B12E4 TaxID=3153564 RepID=UPI00325D4D57
MRTYGDLFRTPEFTPLFAVAAVQTTASTVSGLALGTLVYSVTNSPFLSALSMFGPSVAQMVGATALLSAADRLPPRAALTVLGLAFAIGTVVLVIPGLPGWAVVAVLLGLGLLASLGGGVRLGLLNEILPEQGYVLGRSVLNMSTGITQIAGFAAGGLLVNALSPLRLLLAMPYLVFALDPGLPVAAAAVVLSSIGYAAGLPLQERLVALTPADVRGHALGLHSSGMMTMQGVGAALAGAVAQYTSPAMAMAVMAVASVAVTLGLAPGLREPVETVPA